MFHFQGYHAEVTQAAGDYGVDLHLTKQGKKIAVQAKRYKGNVGLEAVQQVQAEKAHYGATEAWVVTNSDYTDQAYTLAKSNGVRLIACCLWWYHDKKEEQQRPDLCALELPSL
ncbi:restriction endonuclease [Paenibacillus glycinis]|uniref:restriction endonuclease n=1 Tax=Paenibacillus glycinis TaxID=2697035 RepID=UPI001F2344CB|nr:restriction endonuclease [Paenibacillus glycinis]